MNKFTAIALVFLFASLLVLATQVEDSETAQDSSKSKGKKKSDLGRHGWYFASILTR